MLLRTVLLGKIETRRTREVKDQDARPLYYARQHINAIARIITILCVRHTAIFTIQQPHPSSFCVISFIQKGSPE